MSTVTDENPDIEDFNIGQEELPFQDLTKKYIRWMLKRCKGNKYEVARKLNISIRTLYNKLSKYEKEEKEIR